MDLRGRLTGQQIERACSVLDYQPFIITDDIQTGAAYSWAYRAPPESGKDPFVYRRREHAADWDKITDANARLRRMYDAFVAEIAKRYPGGSWLDVACNNGYFPVAAELNDMRGVGMDLGPQFARSVEFLNEALGTNAEFINAAYDSQTHSAPIDGRYTVVSASAILCHLPDPLNFLAFLGSLAGEAVFYWGQLIDSDEFLVSYAPPVLDWHGAQSAFPHRFNRNTRLSRGLFCHGLEEMGFRTIVELPWSTDWLSPHIDLKRRPRPMPLDSAPPEVTRAWELQTELHRGSRHVAMLASR